MQHTSQNTPTSKLIYAEFLQREERRYHHGYDEEMLQYRYIQEGDFRSIAESQRMFRGNINGLLSQDILRHYKYLFVASTTLACRAAIDGGIESQVGCPIGNYIQKKKIEVASNMLLHSGYSLTEIAAFLGFCSTSHFIQTFKKCTGQTPGEYLAHSHH